jgi:hypothetical protein
MRLSDIHRRVRVKDLQALLIDDFPASVAFSLRKLSRDSDKLIQVRRSSDNDLLDFSQEEIKNGALESWVGVTNNGLIRTWYDQSGNNNHAIQTDNTRQPILVENGLLRKDNNNNISIFFRDPSVVLIGDYLQFNNFYENDTQIVDTFSVYSRTANGAFYILGTTPADRGFGIFHTSNVLRQATTRLSATAGNGSAINLNQVYLRNAFVDRVRQKSFLNLDITASLDIPDTNNNFNMPNFCWLGNLNNAGGISNSYLNEFIGYTVSLTDLDKNTIKENIVDYYGII